MRSQAVIRFIHEHPSMFKAMEEFEKTGRVKLKTRMNFTIDRELARKFREYCKQHNCSMSAELEKAIKNKLKSL